jgi:hypothetical protein
MAFAAGSYHGLSYIAETTFGTTPAGTYQALRHTNCSLALTKDGFQSNELRDDRQISDFRHGVLRVGGDIGIEFSYSEFDDMLEAALFGEWSDNVLKAGTTAKSFTMRRRFADILLDGFFTGCMVNSFNLSIPANAMVTGGFGLVGKSASYSGSLHTVTITATNECTSAEDATVTVAGVETTVALTTSEDDTTEVATAIATALDAVSGYTATSSSAVVTLTYPAVDGVYAVSYSAGTTGATATVGTPAVTDADASATHSPFDSFTGVLQENSSTIAVITSIELNLQNGLEPTFVVGSNSTPSITPGRSNLTGTVSAYFENKTLLDKFINETESSIELELGSTSNKYDIEIPRIKYTGGENPASGEGPIVINMPFQALYDSGEGTNLKITRTPE